MTTPDPNLARFSVFLQLEEASRRAETTPALFYTIVNDLRRIVDYSFAALVVGSVVDDEVSIGAVSGVATLDYDTPLIRWLTKVTGQIACRPDAATFHRVVPPSVSEQDRAEWAEWSSPHVLWCPLVTTNGHHLGTVWLARDWPWEDGEIMLLERLCACFAYSWMALGGGKPRTVSKKQLKKSVLVAAGILLLALAVPVSQSALAPVEIVATEPQVMAAPIDGVVARFLVKPNQKVEAGQPLFELDDTTLRNQAAVAERTLGVAQAELRQAVQGAFADRKQAGQMALLDAQVRLKTTELDYAKAMLARVTVKAQQAGVAVFTDANDWIGRPVVTGQRILQIADPKRVEARIALPVRDAIALEPGDRIDLFLDNDPLGRLSAHLTTASFEADQTPTGVTAYRLTAEIEEGQPIPRIGLQGTANIHGRSVPVLLYLFKRPLTALRQWLGY